MKIVIAPDSFKESLTAQQVCEAVKEGLIRVWPHADLHAVPVADGGEGTAQALLDATGGTWQTVEVTGPLGNQVTAKYAQLGDGKTAAIEMAEACGLHLVPRDQRDPERTTSYGMGELVKHALDHGFRHLIIGLGGSATNDGGCGMLMALGAKCYQADGHEIELGGAGLAALSRLDVSGLDTRLFDCDIDVACDVDNPLCGPRGASAIFGPQKGANEQQVTKLDKALHHFGQLVEKVTGRKVIDVKGAGAAGGMGAAWLGLTSANLKPGVEIVLQTTALASQLSQAQLVITGEGRIDGQTVFGKTPIGVAKLAKAQGIAVIAIAGCVGDGYQAVYQHGIDAVFTCLPKVMPLSEALEQAHDNIANVAENIARSLQLNLVK
ncbi:MULTISPECIES: glycerate kinase [unclassified Vibrio]|uniref:Glycerate kinase n=1 Tax=Vibrio sp. HB236076 TaxID=3232307 RepID=A0AB39HII3_9VIBR|nr:glycerate kinase [Vibrio sp. HB161653]MDP5254484.1 glycerate kinase [Vibrio sp. HB161653]